MFTIKEILETTKGRLIAGNRDLRVSGVSIDSRSLRPGELFVAIKGKRFNGHSFITQAIRNHAGAILFSDSCYKVQIKDFQCKNNIPLIRVKGTHQVLGDLAHYHRTKFNIPVIAITGSNGKTTTKEMLSAILSTRFNVLRNPGTQNNQLGVSLAILKLRKKHHLVVVELGANHTGEIKRLSWIAQPTVGIITNIGPAHLEFFKTLKGVFQAKRELMQNLAQNGKLIINKDDCFLSQLHSTNFKIITFGFNRWADFCGQIIARTNKCTTFLLNRKHHIRLKALGHHNVYNALASIAVARNLGISYREIKAALATFQVPAMRMQVLNINNVKIINDCYNANPQSLRCALDFLRECPGQGKKILVCGDMLELGPKALRFHINIGKRVAKSKIDFLITVGQLAEAVARGANLAGMSRKLIRTCCNSSEVAEHLREISRPKDMVLIKGSRAMKMESILECFTSSFTH